MKSLMSVVIISAFFVGFQSSRTDFSGKWKLDKNASKDLPASFAMVKAFTMEVDQTTDSMIVRTELAGPEGPVAFPPTIMQYSGSEVYREDTARGSKRWITASWATTGKKLIVTNRVIQRRGTTEQRYTQTDVWQLSNMNKLMILITQKFEPRDSTHLERRYFARIN